MKLSIFVLIVLSFSMTACLSGGGGSGGGSTAVAKQPDTLVPVDPVTPDPDDGSGATSPTNPSNPTPVSLTYYSLTVTDHPVSSYPSKSVTMTGSCATYQARTFCWDDGTKTIAWSVGPTNYSYTYNYWGLMVNAGHSGGYSTCFGSCATSWLSTPRDVSQNSVSANIQSMSGDTGASVSDVFSHGTQHVASCTEDNGTLNCGSFSIAL